MRTHTVGMWLTAMAIFQLPCGSCNYIAGRYKENYRKDLPGYNKFLGCLNRNTVLDVRNIIVLIQIDKCRLVTR